MNPIHINMERYESFFLLESAPKTYCANVFGPRLSIFLTVNQVCCTRWIVAWKFESLSRVARAAVLVPPQPMTADVRYLSHEEKEEMDKISLSLWYSLTN